MFLFSVMPQSTAKSSLYRKAYQKSVMRLVEERDYFLTVKLNTLSKMDSRPIETGAEYA